MKNDLRTFTFCVKIQGCEQPGSYHDLQIFVGLYWTGLEIRRQIAKKEMRLKRKKEKRKNKKNYKEGRGKKPKIQACLNSQEIRKVNKVKKQNKTNKNK